jgi:hypothetical protein
MEERAGVIPLPPAGDIQLESLLPGVGEVAPECRNRSMHYYRNTNGSCNWLRRNEHTLGAPNSQFGRDRTSNYADGINSPRAVHGPWATPRNLSNLFWNTCKEGRKLWDHTPFVVGFVEFLVHDVMDSFPSKDPNDSYSLTVPKDVISSLPKCCCKLVKTSSSFRILSLAQMIISNSHE